MDGEDRWIGTLGLPLAKLPYVPGRGETKLLSGIAAAREQDDCVREVCYGPEW